MYTLVNFLVNSCVIIITQTQIYKPLVRTVNIAHPCMSRYCFKVSNRAGTVEGSQNLVVKDEEDDSDRKDDPSPVTQAIKVDDFGEYVADMHSKNNSGFISQFQVR